jgi:hypothetical protein
MVPVNKQLRVEHIASKSESWQTSRMCGWELIRPLIEFAQKPGAASRASPRKIETFDNQEITGERLA